MNITNIFIMPWRNAEVGDRVFTFTLLALLISFLPILYFSLTPKARIKERTFNNYLYYVCVPIFAVGVSELLFWPLALVFNSLFMLVFLDKESAKGMCYRERKGIGFRYFEVKDKKYYDKNIEYTKEDLKPYFPNKLIYAFFVYIFPLLVATVFSACGLGYLFWV